eukprot:scaffold17832_cov73-Skeletonema_marinoi.AAC.1
MRHLGCSPQLQHLLVLLLCRSCWLSVHSKVHESSVSRSQHRPSSIDVTTKRCNSFVHTHISCSRHPTNDNDAIKTLLATSSSSDGYLPPPYPLDDDGRPIDIKSNQHLLNGLQTPHSGRKFTPTHPSSSSS